MAPSTVVGQAAPDMDLIVIAEADESQTKLSALRANGQALLIDFFAPWCKACPAAAKHLEELAASGEYTDRCVFLIVCVDGGVDGARAFANDHNIKHCVVAAVEEDDADQYEVSGLPHQTLISPCGVVTHNYKVSLPA